MSMIDSGRGKQSERDLLEASISPDSLDYVAFHGPYGKLQGDREDIYETELGDLQAKGRTNNPVYEESEKGLGCLATAVD
ncbi:hypothetical protein BY996DRAFT_6613858 [Phakopsora pachyrhizi]|nr:hypothetical protein BY996DRAFT_6613858 [Phakopsora pachyrhizi]